MRLTKDGCTMDFPPAEEANMKNLGWKDYVKPRKKKPKVIKDDLQSNDPKIDDLNENAD